MVFYDDLLECDPRIDLGSEPSGEDCLLEKWRELDSQYEMLQLQLVETEHTKPASPWDMEFVFDKQSNTFSFVTKRYNAIYD